MRLQDFCFQISLILENTFLKSQNFKNIFTKFLHHFCLHNFPPPSLKTFLNPAKLKTPPKVTLYLYS